MAYVYSPTYDPGIRGGTSGAEVSDLRPEQAYDIDLRNVEPQDRNIVAATNQNQERIARFMKAARSAGKFRQKAGIDEPMIRGKTLKSEVSIAGLTLPTVGDRFGRGGGTNYADKPLANFGRPF